MSHRRPFLLGLYIKNMHKCMHVSSMLKKIAKMRQKTRAIKCYVRLIFCSISYSFAVFLLANISLRILSCVSFLHLWFEKDCYVVYVIGFLCHKDQCGKSCINHLSCHLSTNIQNFQNFNLTEFNLI